MRFALISLLCLPALANAETFVVPSKATSATLYAKGGLVTHGLSLTLPAGNHQIVLPDLPPNLPTEALRVASGDLKLISLSYRTDFVPPSAGPDTPEILAAREKIEDILAEIQSVRDDANRVALTAEAAEDQIEFLSSLAGSDGLPTQVENLRALTRMIGEEALKIREVQFDAELEERQIREVLAELSVKLREARAALRALVPRASDRPLLVIDVAAAEAVENTPISVTFFSDDVRWRPTYDVRLSMDDAPQITLERGAWVRQSTGENWDDIELTLSTQQLEQGVDPAILEPDWRRLFDPDEGVRTQRLYSADAEVAVSAVLGLPTVTAAGLETEYRYATPVRIASDADEVRLPFDSQSFDATLVARAVPMRNDRAYLVAKFTNTIGEPFLSSRDSRRYLSNALVGAATFPELAPGATAELGFGPISGLKLGRTVLRRNEGDRGLISRNNEQTEQVRIDLENLTDRTWAVELIDRVPYSEQEELLITYAADPSPDVPNVGDQRGILQWNIEMPPGNTANVTTKFTMTWPDGKSVR